MFNKTILAIAFILFLAGCAGGMAAAIPFIDPHDANAVYAGTRAVNDPYKGSVTINGPLIHLDNDVFGSMYGLRIVKGIDKGQLYVVGKFRDWAYLDTAYSGGKKYDVVKIEQNVRSCGNYGCTVEEHVGVSLTMKEMRALAKKDSFGIKISGRDGNMVLNVPGAYFQAVLKKLDEQ